MRVVSIPLATANSTKAYLVDRDTTLITAGLSNGTAVISTDPALLMAAITTPAAGGPNSDIIALVTGGASSPTLGGAQLLFQLTKGQTIWIANVAACWVFLQFSDPLSAENLVT
jgi:hypothetical protein